jgi:hypothetical protein
MAAVTVRDVPDISLAEFVRARVDEDEQAATAAAGPHKAGRKWWVDPWFDGTGGRADINTHLGIITSSRGGVEAVPAEHIVRWDPARVLAEVEAKRRIIDEYEQFTSGRLYSTDREQTLRRVVSLLALPHIGHPDYRQEWRVS